MTQQVPEVTRKWRENCSEGVVGKEIARQNCSNGIPEWLEDFTEKLEIVETPAAPENFHDSHLERPMKVVLRKHSILYLLPRRPKLRSLQATQNYKGSLQKANWENSTSGREILWFIWSQPITKSSTKDVNIEIIIDIQLWYKI